MPPKRKRATDSGSSRPAPHRPGDTSLGQHDNGSRYGGRGGRSTRRNDRRDSSHNSYATGPSPSSTAPTPTTATSPTFPRPSSSSSQTATAPLNTAIPSMPPSAPASPIDSGYHYDIVTDERLGNWIKGGRQEVVDHGVQSRDDEDVQELSTIFQELFQSCLDFRLKATDAGQVAKEIIGPRSPDADKIPQPFDPHTLLLDTLSIFIDVESGAYRPSIRDFMIATDIDPMLMRTVLEPGLLEGLGLIRETFTKLGIRHATNILYKQANYNLLREETEGYAKLATELFTTSNSEPPSAEVVQATFERVKGLIGTFDLDVGRVLDVTLDVFGSVLIKHYRFFVRLLRVSSWWPRNQPKHDIFSGGLPMWALPESPQWTTSEDDEVILAEQRRQRDILFWDKAREKHIDAYFELGGRQVAHGDLQRFQNIVDAVKAEQQANADDADVVSKLDPETQWIVATKTLPPQGNRVAAQLLGFKLRFYESKARDEDDVLPANIFYLTALLIKIGFISLADLYPHITPLDSDMDAVRQARMKVLEEEERKKNGTGGGALAMLGVLPEDEKDVARASKINAELRAANSAAATDKKKDPEVHYQKVMLLTELLTLGAIPESLLILGRFPWLVEAFPPLIKLINRLLKYSVSKVFQESRPTNADAIIPSEPPLKQLPDLDQGSAPKGSIKLSQVPPKRPLRWPYPDGEKDNTTYRFYWEEWADNVPICQTVDDIFTLCSTLMNVSGVNIGRDSALLTSLASIGATSLAQDKSQHNMSRWQDLLKRLLVPALSLTESNSAAVLAVWDLLKMYPSAVRYNIYAEWFLGQTSRNPAIKLAFARTRAETTGILKRISAQNFSAMGKKLAKIAYASPGVVFKTALDQIEAYPNLIQAFVECAKYFTDLGYDVLTWSLMSSLGGETRSRTQASSVLLTSKWLQALSKFSGQVFKRYRNLKPSPVLQYVNDQLSNGNATDLVILREIISAMAGVIPDADFTDAQLKAMTGGEVLRRQTLINLGDRRFESGSGARRLMQSLLDTKLAGRLLINLAQYRQSALYKLPEEQSNIKYMATIMDEVHQALAQYLDLLRSNLPAEQFDTLVPDVLELMTDFGLDVSLAFMIGRASLLYRMANPKALPFSSQPAQEVVDVDGDLPMNGDPTASTVARTADSDNVAEDKMAVDERESAEAPPDSTAAPASSNTRKSDPMIDVLQPIVDTMQITFPSTTWERMSPEFYVMFWSLSLGDLHVPTASYEAEHLRLNKEAEDVMKDRSDMTRPGMNRKDEKRKALVDLAKSVREEMSSHVERYQKTKFWLAKQSKLWFPGSMAETSLVSDTILEQCILPRLLVSATDTEYSFRMIKFLHENRTPNFKLFALYEQLFNANRLRSMVFSCTVREADHLGRFIRCILEDLARWHANKTVYEKEALGQKGPARNFLGFATAFDEEGKPTAFVEHSFFRDSHYEWHKNLNTALKGCLQGTTEWMHIRNAITVLKSISDFFPAVNFMGTQLLKVLDDIKVREEGSKGSSEEGHRVDLAVTAQTVFSALKKRESKWVAVQAFRPNMSGRPQEGAKDGEPAGSNLRPTAPEFKPPQSKTTSGQPAEVEDGEVTKTASSVDVEMSDVAPKTASTMSKPAQDKDVPKDLINKDKAAAVNNRPATPKSSAAVSVSSSSNRIEISRQAAATSKLDRPPHSLPSRPDVPIPGNYRPDRLSHVAVNERRDSSRDRREPRDPKEARDPREPKEARDLLREPRDASRDTREHRDHRTLDAARIDRRENQESERRGKDNISREPGRGSERDWPRSESSQRRGDHGPSADRDARPSRDRGTPAAGQDGRSVRGATATTASASAHAPAVAPIPVSTPQPSTSLQSPVEEPPINPQRAALFADERPEIVNPARAALIQNTQTPSARSPRDTGRGRTSSRPQSPRRDERHASNIPVVNSSRGDDRHGRSHQSDHHASTRDAHVEPIQPVPRERDQPRDHDRSGRSTTDRVRETPSQVPPPSSRPHDSDRARAGQHDPNYGRLNSTQPAAAPEIPQGPRGRGGRNSSRISSMPVPPSRPDSRMPGADINRPPSPGQHPPTGPSSTRPRRSQPAQFDQNANTSPAVPATSPVVSMHPDRMRHFTPATPVHPDRVAHIGAPPPPPPPPGQPSNPRANLPPIQTMDRNSMPGPAGSRPASGSLPGTPVGEQNTPYSTPTGPSSANDRIRGGGRRQFAGLNNHLRAAQSDTPERGLPRRSGVRSALPGSDAQVLTGASPVSTPHSERQDLTRRDLITDRPPVSNELSGPPPPPRDPRTGVNGDDFSASRGDHERGSRRDHHIRSERSGHRSGRGSGERSPRGERDVKESREHRDRHRSGAPVMDGGSDPNHEPIAPRRSTRDSIGSTSTSTRDLLPGPSREVSGSGRDSRHRGGEPRVDVGSGARPAEERGSGGRGGSMRGAPRDSGPRLGDDRRDSRGGEDRGRKRRSGEDLMPPPSDRDKRPRR